MRSQVLLLVYFILTEGIDVVYETKKPKKSSCVSLNGNIF